jgi:hypothetical protein
MHFAPTGKSTNWTSVTWPRIAGGTIIEHQTSEAFARYLSSPLFIWLPGFFLFERQANMLDFARIPIFIHPSTLKLTPE